MTVGWSKSTAHPNSPTSRSRRTRHEHYDLTPAVDRLAPWSPAPACRARPLTSFLVLGLGLGYAFALLWGLAYYGAIPGGGLADALHIAPDELVGGATILSLFPAALIVTWAADGSSGVRTLFRRAFQWRVSPAWWLIVLLGLPVLTVGLALLFGDDLRSVDTTSLIISQLGFLIINFIVVNLWEETTWTGFFQTRLEQRHNWLVASVLTAIPFAAIHLPLQFFLDEPVTVGSLAAAFAVYLVFGLLVRPLLAVFRRAHRRQPAPGRPAAQRLQPDREREWCGRHAARRTRPPAHAADRRRPAHRRGRRRCAIATQSPVRGRARRVTSSPRSVSGTHGERTRLGIRRVSGSSSSPRCRSRGLRSPRGSCLQATADGAARGRRGVGGTGGGAGRAVVAAGRRERTAARNGSPGGTWKPQVAQTRPPSLTPSHTRQRQTLIGAAGRSVSGRACRPAGSPDAVRCPARARRPRADPCREGRWTLARGPAAPVRAGSSSAWRAPERSMGRCAGSGASIASTRSASSAGIAPRGMRNRSPLRTATAGSWYRATSNGGGAPVRYSV